MAPVSVIFLTIDANDGARPCRRPSFLAVKRSELIERYRRAVRIGRDSPDRKMLRWWSVEQYVLLILRSGTLSAKRACVVVVDTEPDRLAPLG